MSSAAAPTLHIQLTLSDRANQQHNYVEMLSQGRRLYFGYGSNLWQAQMRQRCPTSKYLGRARLKGYRWIIYERGYANIVRVSPDDHEHVLPQRQNDGEGEDVTHEVWGLVYSLEPEDEERLDRNEGVPMMYQKEVIACDFWPSIEEEGEKERQPVKKQMLVYINHQLIGPGVPKEEYIKRMNHGIQDAIREGVPKEYVRQVIRWFIPKKQNDK